VTRMNKELVG